MILRTALERIAATTMVKQGHEPDREACALCGRWIVVSPGSRLGCAEPCSGAIARAALTAAAPPTPPAEPSLPTRTEPYYLIERNDRGRAEWLLINPRWHPETWTVDAGQASRWFERGSAESSAVTFRQATGLALTVTEHLDVPSPPATGMQGVGPRVPPLKGDTWRTADGRDWVFNGQAGYEGDTMELTTSIAGHHDGTGITGRAFHRSDFTDGTLIAVHPEPSPVPRGGETK